MQFQKTCSLFLMSFPKGTFLPSTILRGNFTDEFNKVCVQYDRLLRVLQTAVMQERLMPLCYIRCNQYAASNPNWESDPCLRSLSRQDLPTWVAVGHKVLCSGSSLAVWPCPCGTRLPELVQLGLHRRMYARASYPASPSPEKGFSTCNGPRCVRAPHLPIPLCQCGIRLLLNPK